ncbi:ASCH/PUA domain-containing protein [Clostridium cagae]|uniref:ASCH/PUA domain-containing protein n=1 Tax=Clostridium cagae TaxID=2080751 RepID=UPI003F77424E
MSKIHELKILPKYFNAVLDGTKTFELRKNDRGFEVGDTLVLKEYLQEISDRYKTTLHAQYTGQEVKKEISYILDGGKYGLQEGYVILALGEYKEMGNITDEEIEAFGKFSDYEKVIIKEQYSKYPKGFFPNPMCALY